MSKNCIIDLPLFPGKRKTACMLLFGFLVYHLNAVAQPRLVISSDFPPVNVIPGGANEGPLNQRSDPDDVQSMVRLLLYANEFKLEGLIAASGTLANEANKQHLLDILSVYDAVDEQLRLHDIRYPQASYLKDISKQGLSGTYGKPASEIVGSGKDSEASQYIIDLVDQPDPAPIWFCFWGGTQEMAQALWQVKTTRSPGQVKQFINKLRLYFIDHQDGTAQWIKDEFPDVFTVDNRKSFRGMFYYRPGADSTLGDSAWVQTQVRTNHGPLGAVYPPSGWDPKMKGVIEGDSPSFLYVYSQVIGLSDPEKPWMGSWGGRFIKQREDTGHWEDAPEEMQSIIRWQSAYQADFAARLDQCVLPPGKVNIRPKAIINGDTTNQIVYMRAKAGKTITFHTKGSSDPEGQLLAYQWFAYPEAGNYRQPIRIKGHSKPKASMALAKNTAGTQIHIILALTDYGSPRLTSYRRLVIDVE